MSSIYVSRVVYTAVLRRFANYLLPGLIEPGKVRMQHLGNRRYAGAISGARPMGQEEVRLWNDLFSIQATLEEMAQAGSLMVVIGPREGGYRVNFDDATYGNSLDQADIREARFFVRPHAYMSGWSQRELYNAFMALDVYAQDSKGRWLLSAIPGTGGGGWRGSEVYSPHGFATSSLWFNTVLRPSAGNSFEGGDRIKRRDSAMFSCRINRRDDVDSMELPEDERLRFFFWQMGRFLAPWAWLHGRRALM